MVPRDHIFGRPLFHGLMVVVLICVGSLVSAREPAIDTARMVEVELASNDDWLDHPTADCLVPERQLEPRDDREAALLITLPAGTYIAVLESATADGTCSAVYGNGIIEVNDVRLFPEDVQP